MKRMNHSAATAIRRHHICLQCLSTRGLYVHLLPGRLRLDAPGLKGSPALAARVQQMLEQTPGVTRAECRSTTCRILVEFVERRIDADTLVERLADLGCFGHATAVHGHATRPAAAPKLLHLIADFAGGLAVDAVLNGLI